MIIDMEEKPGEWFPLHGGGRVQLKALSKLALKAILKQCVTKKADYVLNKVTRSMERVEHHEVNEDLQSALFWDAVIVSWEGIFDSKERPIKCTKENKVLLMTRSEAFSESVGDGLRTLQSIRLEERVSDVPS